MLLKTGSIGKDVKRLQLMLGINSDGKFGQNTNMYIRNWQSKNGLLSDGIVGDKTWTKVSNEYDKSASILKLDNLRGILPDSIIEQIKESYIKFNITTNIRLAHFLAQCAHESGNFKITSENLNYSQKGLLSTFSKYFNSKTVSPYIGNPVAIASRVYANRMGNGDELSKEGYKYRGRGFIQLTGKSNYISFGKFINVDLVSNPDLVATKYPLASAAFFFNTNKIWDLCEIGNSIEEVRAITIKINGGTNGLDDRIKRFNTFYNLLK